MFVFLQMGGRRDDLEVIKDLLELVNDGFSVTWPKGLDEIEARRLLKRSSQEEDAKPSIRRTLRAP